MSGPKVVRIVTREEIVAICQGQLAQLDRAISQWQQKMAKYQMKHEAFHESIQENRQQLSELLENELFLDLQKAVPIEIEELRSDIKSRLKQRIEKRAKGRSEQRARKENTALLLKTLEAKRVAIPSELLEELQQIMQGKDTVENSKALGQAFILLHKRPEETELTQEQQALIERMDDGSTTQTFSQWQAQQQTSRNPRFTRVDRCLAELEFVDEGNLNFFATRLAMIEVEPDKNRLNLLLDSLLLDINSAIKEAEQHAVLIEKLQMLVADLQGKQSDLAQALQASFTELDKASLEELQGLISYCEELLEEANKTIAATYRRQTLLQGLAKLGYEVHEGMDTLWASEGKVVIRNPVTPGYGVELGGQAEAARLQVRTVKFTSTEDKQRDTDVEQLWCGDFDRLKDLLVQQGGDLVIEKALPAGNVVLKKVADVMLDSPQQSKQKRYMSSTS